MDGAGSDESQLAIKQAAGWGLAGAFTHMGDICAAETTWKTVLDEGHLDKARRLEALCAYVDLQVGRTAGSVA